MDFIRTHQAVSRSLRPDQRLAVSRALPNFLARGGLRGTPQMVRQHAAGALRQSIAHATPAEIDALTSYFLTRLALSLRGTAAEKTAVTTLTVKDLVAVQAKMQSLADSLSELGEMASLRLQMNMDRVSKQMSTLSNILKAIADTQKNLISNLK